MGERVQIFDTSLRDGEQSPGVALTTEDKLEIAQQLEKLGVDIIEAGFPLTSQGDLEGVQRVAEVVREPVIAALAHANADAVDAAQLQEDRLRANGVLVRHRETVDEIDVALGKLGRGTYGVSETTGEPISYERLALIPWARAGLEEQ